MNEEMIKDYQRQIAWLDEQISDGERRLKFLKSRIEELTTYHSGWIRKLDMLNEKRTFLNNKLK